MTILAHLTDRKGFGRTLWIHEPVPVIHIAQPEPTLAWIQDLETKIYNMPTDTLNFYLDSYEPQNGRAFYTER